MLFKSFSVVATKQLILVKLMDIFFARSSEHLRVIPLVGKPKSSKNHQKSAKNDKFSVLLREANVSKFLLKESF